MAEKTFGEVFKAEIEDCWSGKHSSGKTDGSPSIHFDVDLESESMPYEEKEKLREMFREGNRKARVGKYKEKTRYPTTAVERSLWSIERALEREKWPEWKKLRYENAQKRKKEEAEKRKAEKRRKERKKEKRVRRNENGKKKF